MEFFNIAKAVRLRKDEETVRQSRNDSSQGACWKVELVQGDSHLIRLKSIYNKYLTASGEPFLLGMIGNKVLQTIPLSKNDGFTEWESINDQFRVKFRARNGQLLRANGGPPQWRKVMHDIPHRTATQDWVLWGVDLIEILEQDLINFSHDSERSQHSDKGSASLITHNFKHAFGREASAAMEIFEEASIVRFRSIHDKYLLAEDDEETVSQERGGTVRNARWTVEFVQFNSTHIRLKSCYGKYLTASNMPFLLGMTGKKVLQTLPKRLDSSVEWEPIQEGSRVRLKTRYGQYLRANGGIPPWRNHITHDTPYRTSHQDWILWQVDILRFRHQDKLPAPPPPFQVQADGFDNSDTGSPPTISLRGSRMSKNEEDDSGNGSPKAFEGRIIKYEVVDDNGDVDQNIGERKFIFKGNGVDDLKKALKEENVVKEEFSLCSRNPLNGNLYPLRLQLPPNNTAMHVVLVPLSSKVADDLWL
ncbi:hypothetical protein V6Z12_D09G027000 [Gossypium hirsutum]